MESVSPPAFSKPYSLYPLECFCGPAHLQKVSLLNRAGQSTAHKISIVDTPDTSVQGPESLRKTENDIEKISRRMLMLQVQVIRDHCVQPGSHKKLQTFFFQEAWNCCTLLPTATALQLAGFLQGVTEETPRCNQFNYLPSDTLKHIKYKFLWDSNLTWKFGLPSQRNMWKSYAAKSSVSNLALIVIVYC